MKLEKLDTGDAIVTLDPQDCSHLSAICRTAAENLIGCHEVPLANMARTYQSLFQSLMIAAVTPGHLGNVKPWMEEMQSLQVENLVTDAIY